MSFLEMITILGAAFGGAVIGAFISHCFTTQRENKRWRQTLELLKIQEYNKAADIFRSEFIYTIYQLKNAKTSAYMFLYKILPQLEKAMMLFRINLSGEKLKNFDSAWKEFAFSEKDDPDNMLQYVAHKPDEVRRLCDLAIQRIEKLLKAAKPK